MGLPEKYKGATKGPWKVFGQNDEHDLSVDADDLCGCLTSQAVGPENDEPVCMVVTKGFGPSADRRHDAHAMLIADAPMLACRVVELEDVLQPLLEIVESELADDCAPEELTDWIKAIAKARQLLGIQSGINEKVDSLITDLAANDNEPLRANDKPAEVAGG